MYEVFEKLMKKCGYSSYKVSVETGIAQSTLSDWKTGKSTPKADKMQKIADLFGVSVEYLMTGNEPDTLSDNALSTANALLALNIANDQALSSALQKYFELSDSQKQYVVGLINLLAEGK